MCTGIEIAAIATAVIGAGTAAEGARQARSTAAAAGRDVQRAEAERIAAEQQAALAANTKIAGDKRRRRAQASLLAASEEDQQGTALLGGAPPLSTGSALGGQAGYRFSPGRSVRPGGAATVLGGAGGGTATAGGGYRFRPTRGVNP